MGYSEIGNAASYFLLEIQHLRSNIAIDEFMIMPNHPHCIIEIEGDSLSLENANHYGKPVAGSISVIVNQYKGKVKKWCNANGFPGFEWQARFYDRVIRDNEEYFAIKDYILANPLNWDRDKWHVALTSSITCKNKPPADVGGFCLVLLDAI